jgi:hypothetical protein
VNAPAVNTELSQLLTTVTIGAEMVECNGAAVPLAPELVHPLTVWVTVYVPGVVTVIELVVAPLLHNNEPVNDSAVNIELTQLSTTVTAGGSTTALIGAAVPLPSALIHPLTIWVTV